MEEWKQTIKEQFHILPPELKTYVLATDWRKGVGTIAESQGLTPDQAGTLELVVLLVLIALENLANLNQRIQTELNMNPQTAEKIADMTREKIITPVKLHLLPLQEDEVSEVSESERGQKEVNSTPKQEESLTMLDDKLNSITKLPSEETHYTDSSAQTIPKPLEQAAKPNTPGLNPSSNISPSPIVKNQNQDPYREPIN